MTLDAAPSLARAYMPGGVVAWLWSRRPTVLCAAASEALDVGVFPANAAVGSSCVLGARARGDSRLLLAAVAARGVGCAKSLPSLTERTPPDELGLLDRP